ncbi:hypothetical protein ILT44_09545 [Microvirga sp. BT689]|uniref:hypothetical protein n=1 Tax=Microvirga arvi TaxID=2778731 RepID=UPI00195047F4|nr:hypothetical protein [Microvirga arvi]MBM6580421.1 hypothetical protein [Microvirga arvi]
MSTDRAESGVEAAIKRHLAKSYQQRTTAAYIRDRITDSFQPDELRIEQDNQPPALAALQRRIIAAFSPIEREGDIPDRSADLAALKRTLERQRSAPSRPDQKHLLAHAKSQLLIERQQLFLKNEFTEGFGRLEIWALSIAILTLLLLNVVSVFWGLPLFALSIGRAWHLDRQCKRRLAKISEIDALLERIEHAPCEGADLRLA